jgi:2'-5' RNA ligase
VVWTAVAGAGVETLRALQKALAAASARLNYPADGKDYHPHVTLGRFSSPRGRRAGPPSSPDAGRTLARLIGHYRTWRAGPFRVSEAVVFASSLGRDGPVYAPLATAPLLGRNPAPRRLDAARPNAIE